MSRSFQFRQLDVFASDALRGNPVAVVSDASALSDDEMAAFARWTNLSETTFLLPPTDAQADYQVRIFTPGGELPFAGHPTLGSCQAWLLAGGEPREPGLVIQQCGIGPVRVRVDADFLAFEAPPLTRSGPLEEDVLEQATAALGISLSDVESHHWVVNGPEWAALLLESGEVVRQLQPDFAAMGSLKLGVVGPQRHGEDSDFEVRAFAPGVGVPEDPVTGSLNAGLGRWLIRSGLAENAYRVRQGTVLQRAGDVLVEQIEGEIWVGGAVRCCIEGTLSL